jgi:hypothetical protein
VRCPKMHDATGVGSWAASAPKVRCAATRGCCECVKEAPYEAEARGATCKGVSAVRRHAGGLYDAGSYCYTLVKCLKPFVRNGKGVIEADDHARGSPINSEPLVMKRTHCDEKRVPKAPASLSVFGLLSISLFSLLVSCRQQLRRRVESSREKRVSDFSARLRGGLQAAVIRRGEKFSGGLLCRRPPSGPISTNSLAPTSWRIQNRMARTRSAGAKATTAQASTPPLAPEPANPSASAI